MTIGNDLSLSLEMRTVFIHAVTLFALTSMGCEKLNPAVPDTSANRTKTTNKLGAIPVKDDRESLKNRSRTSEPTPTVVQTVASGDRQAAISRIDLMVMAGWSKSSANAVLELNKRYLDFLLEIGHDKQHSKVIKSLANLGARESIVDFLEIRPEMASYFLHVEPSRLLQMLRDCRRDDYPFVATLLTRGIEANCCEEILCLLEKKQTRDLSIDLQKAGFIGAEAILLNAFRNEQDRQYLKWVCNKLSSSLRHRDHDEIASILITHSEFGHRLKNIFREDSALARKIEDEYWPFLMQLSRESDFPIECYVAEEHIWALLSMPGEVGKRLARKFGILAVRPFFEGKCSWPEELHRKIAEIMLDDCNAVASKFILDGDYSRLEPMRGLLEKKISNRQFAVAFARISSSDNPSDELAYLSSLESSVLRSELVPGTSGSFDWVPLVTTVKTIKKSIDGRRVSAWEWAAVAVDVGSVVLIVTPTGPIAHTAKGVSGGAKTLTATNKASSALTRLLSQSMSQTGKMAGSISPRLQKVLHTSSAVRQITFEISESIAKQSTIDVTNCARSFYKSMGLKPKQLKLFSGVESKVLAAPSGHILFHLDRFAVNNADRFFKAAKIAKSERKTKEAINAVKEEMSAYALSHFIEFAN